MPVKKGTQAYEAKLARRRINRAINNMNKIAKSKSSTLNERAAAKNTLKQLKESLAGTYQKKGRTSEQIAGAIISGSRLAKSTKIVATKHGKADLATQWQLNLGGKRLKEGEVNISKYTRGEVKAFYRATQKLWQSEGKTDIATINKRIISQFGGKSLSEIVDTVLSNPEVRAAADAYDLGKKHKKTPHETARQEELREGQNEDADKTSEIGLILPQIYEPKPEEP
nr:MAG TPA: hypothetical protein [Bacteriophage sp.]